MRAPENFFVPIMAALQCVHFSVQTGSQAASQKTYAEKLATYDIRTEEPPAQQDEDEPGDELLPAWAPSEIDLINVGEVIAPFLVIFWEQTNWLVQLTILSRLIKIVHSFQDRAHSCQNIQPNADWLAVARTHVTHENFWPNLSEQLLWGIKHGFELSNKGQQYRMNRLVGTLSESDDLLLLIEQGLQEQACEALKRVEGPLNEYIVPALKLDDRRFVDLLLPRVDIDKLVRDHTEAEYDLGCSYFEDLLEHGYNESLEAFLRWPALEHHLCEDFGSTFLEMCVRNGNLAMFKVIESILGPKSLAKIHSSSIFDEAVEQCLLSFLESFVDVVSPDSLSWGLFGALNEGAHNPGYLQLAKILVERTPLTKEMWWRVLHNGSMEPISFFVQHESIWRSEFATMTLDEIIEKVNARFE